MISFLKIPVAKALIPDAEISAEYSRKRWQVFVGIFIGYAAYYLVRKNFSLVMPDLIAQGYSKSDLGFVLSGVSISYGLSKFIMGNVSDQSNARTFLTLGLILSACTMIFMGVSPWATSSVAIMFSLQLLNGWFQGMGWPPSGRVMVHWFSKKERGTKMSVWNVAHNIGGGLIGPITIWAVAIFGNWQSMFFVPGLLALVLAAVTYTLVRDRPAACGLPAIEDYHQNEVIVSIGVEKLSAKEVFVRYVLYNRVLWLIAFANAFVYLVRYGVLDWAPTYLQEVKHYSVKESGWAYFAYEYAGIPGTLLCGWLSDKMFNGRRAPATLLYMFLVMIAVFIYWKNPPGTIWIDNASLIAIGFLIYGPVMLIGVQALDSVPSQAAGTAAGLTGLFGYLGGALFANIAMGYIVDTWGWDGGFLVILTSCLLAIFFTAFTWNNERKPEILL